MKYCSRVSVFKASTCFSSRFFFFFYYIVRSLALRKKVFEVEGL